MNKRAVFWTILLCLTLASLLCSCANGHKTGSLTWKIKDDTLIISGNGPMPNYPVTGGPWSKDIAAIQINEGVTNIGDNAFYRCSGVVSVSIPGSVTNIGENAFVNCSSITSITIPEGVLTIGKSAFESCVTLKTIVLGKKVQIIGPDAFLGCTNILAITSENRLPPIIEVSLRLNPLRNLTAEEEETRLSNIEDDSWNVDKHADATPVEIDAFYSVDKEKCRLTVPDAFIAAYKEDKSWSSFLD